MNNGDLKQKQSYLPDIHRQLPQSPDAEQGILSSFMLAPGEIGALCAEKRVTPAHFHIPAHATIYEFMLADWSEGRAIDFITLTQRLRDAGALDAVGGAAFVTSLFTFLPTAANAGYYVEIVREKHILREVIRVCTEHAARSFDEQDDPHGLTASAAEKIMGIFTNQAADGIPTMKENAKAVTDWLENAYDATGSIISTGLRGLDEEVGPFERGNLLVIGGERKAGKSILSGQIALNMALAGKPVVYVSLEMTERELTTRMAASLGRINTRLVRTWKDAELNRLHLAIVALSPLPIHIVCRRYSLAEIVAVFRQFHARYKDQPQPLAAIVLDYAQLASAEVKDDRREQEIAKISQTCKRCAGELNVLAILLTQLNDAGRSRESRTIEMDCNAMLEVGHDESSGERGIRVVCARSAPASARLPLRIIAEHTRVEDEKPNL